MKDSHELKVNLFFTERNQIGKHYKHSTLTYVYIMKFDWKLLSDFNLQNFKNKSCYIKCYCEISDLILGKYIYATKYVFDLLHALVVADRFYHWRYLRQLAPIIESTEDCYISKNKTSTTL